MFVIFGASGDLTRRKLIPALYNLACDNLLPHDFTVIGFAVTPMDGDTFCQEMEKGVRESKEAILSTAAFGTSSPNRFNTSPEISPILTATRTETPPRRP